VHRRLEREIAHLEAEGTTVIRLEPGPEARHAMGLWAMAEHRAPKVVEAAYEETRSRIHASPFLAGLGESHPAAAAGSARADPGGRPGRPTRRKSRSRWYRPCTAPAAVPREGSDP
jgi:hypothetical protein